MVAHEKTHFTGSAKVVTHELVTHDRYRVRITISILAPCLMHLPSQDQGGVFVAIRISPSQAKIKRRLFEFKPFLKQHLLLEELLLPRRPFRGSWLGDELQHGIDGHGADGSFFFNDGGQGRENGWIDPLAPGIPTVKVVRHTDGKQFGPARFRTSIDAWPRPTSIMSKVPNCRSLSRYRRGMG